MRSLLKILTQNKLSLKWLILGMFPTAQAGRISTAELVSKLFNFCEYYSGKQFYPYQERFSKRVIRSVITNDGDEITALFSRQSGKTETVATTIGGLMILLPIMANMAMFVDDPRLQMFKEGLWVGVFAPSQKQASTAYNRIRARLDSKTAKAVFADPGFNLFFTTSNGQTCTLSNGSFVTSISASDQSNIEGDSYMLIFCDECQDISNFKIRKSIHPMGAAYNATIVKIGTATTHVGDFFEAINRNKREDEKKSSSTRNHFQYNYEVVMKYNAKYAKYIEGEKKRLGEKSDEFQMSYNLKWIIERGMFVDITKFEQENTESLMERVMYDKTNTHVGGIDVAGKGDSTWITIVEVNWEMPVIQETRIDPETNEEFVYSAYNTYIKDWYVISNAPDFEEQYHMIVDYLRNWRIARLVCDATKEASLAHRLRANLTFEVWDFIFTSKSKSELYKHLSKEIDSGRARVPAGENTIETKEYKDFIEQLGELQKGYSGQYLVVSHPNDKNAHDDAPDSWALAVWGCSSRGEVNITQTIDNNLFNQQSRQQSEFSRMRNSMTARRRR